MPTIDNVTVEKIVQEAELILSQKKEPQLLSFIGQELNKRLNTAIRPILENKRLGDLLIEHFGDRYEVQGIGPDKEIGPKGSWTHKARTINFVSEFWRAFQSIPVAGSFRWLRIKPSLQVVEAKEKPAGDEWILIDPIYIVDPQGLPKPGPFVRRCITLWSEAHKVDLEQFYDVDRQLLEPNNAMPQQSNLDAESIEALRKIISLIPTEERIHHQMNFALLARLLDVD